MKSYVKIIGYVLSALGVSVLWANEPEGKHSDCGRLHIQIGNASSSACQLVKSTVVHGQLSTSPPAMVYPGMTERFDIHQTLRGPEIKLQYRCNGKQITFTSRQNYCFLAAGDVSATIISADPGIDAYFTKENGSYYWDKPGFVNWIVNVK